MVSGRDVPQEHHMVGVVRIGVAPPDAGALLDGRRDVQVLVHHREVQQGGGAAEQGGAADLLGRRRQEARMTDDGGGDVGMRFDAAGHHHHPGSVDDPAHLAVKDPRLGHGHDLLSLDRHVPHSNAHGGDDRPAPHDQVQHLRLRPFSRGRGPRQAGLPPLGRGVASDAKPTPGGRRSPSRSSRSTGVYQPIGYPLKTKVKKPRTIPIRDMTRLVFWRIPKEPKTAANPPRMAG